MTSKRVAAKKHGLIRANSKASTEKVRNMVQVNIHTPTDQFIKVIGQIIVLRVLVLIRGQTVNATQDNGKKTTCTAKEYLLGPMEENMKVSTFLIANTDLESTLGLMGDSTLVSGKMDSNMVKAYIRTLMVQREQVFGRMVKELHGSTMKTSRNKWNN